MRALIQRVAKAEVSIGGQVHAQIDSGLLVLLGIAPTDSSKDVDYIVRKILNLRIFNDLEGKMNLSLQDVKGEILLISQFTLYAETKKGNRPSYVGAAAPDAAIPLYELVKTRMKEVLDNKLKSGVFGADMQVSLLNDGPVTIFLESTDGL